MKYKHLPVFLLISLLLITLIPALYIKFNWVDDGWDIQRVQEFVDSARKFDLINFAAKLFETSGGRFRPVYWFWRIITYLIAGYNPTIHFCLRFLLISGTLIYIYKIIINLTKSRWIGFFSSSTFLVTSLNTENWYRLGPQEPLLGLFISASIFYLIEGKRKLLSYTLLLLAIFSKETAFAIIPAIFILYFFNKFTLKVRNIMLEKYLILGSIYFLLMFIITSIIRAGYSEFYAFELGRIFHNFLAYIKIATKELAPFSYILILSFVARTFYLFVKQKFKMITPYFLYQVFFGVWFLSFSLIQAPWAYVMFRYMLPSTIGLLIFFGLELNILSKLIFKNENHKDTFFRYIFWLVFAIYLVISLLKTINYGQRTAMATEYLKNMTDYLANNVKKNNKVYLNFAKGEGTIELVIETGLHLNIFYKRKDIEVDYFDIENLPKKPFYLVSGTSVPYRYPEMEIENKLKTKPDITIESQNNSMTFWKIYYVE